LALSKIENALKGQKDLLTFLTSNAMLARGIPENDFQDCFQQWHHRLTRCTASQGEYFETTAAASAQVQSSPEIKFPHLAHIHKIILADKSH
jgi:hypothetical protein